MKLNADHVQFLESPAAIQELMDGLRRLSAVTDLDRLLLRSVIEAYATFVLMFGSMATAQVDLTVNFGRHVRRFLLFQHRNRELLQELSADITKRLDREILMESIGPNSVVN